MISRGADEIMQDWGQMTDWDLACHFQSLKAQFKKEDPSGSRRSEIDHIKAKAIAAILQRAKVLIGSLVRPQRQQSVAWNPLQAMAEDLDLERTLENRRYQSGRLSIDENYYVVVQEAQFHPVILCIDTSLSMTGEKLALTAVALAVVMLHFPPDQISVVAFESHAQCLKGFARSLPVEELLGHFLEVPSQGYTHLEAGLLMALQEQKAVKKRRGHHSRVATLLLSDGKFTAGKDPSYLSASFDQLSVIKMGEDQSSLKLCKDLARGSRGRFAEVKSFEALPALMYAVVKDLIKGASPRNPAPVWAGA